MEMESLFIDPKNPVSPTTSGYRLSSRFSDGKNCSPAQRCSNGSLVYNNNNNENLLPTVTIQSDDDFSQQKPKNLILFRRTLKHHQNLNSTSIISKSIDHQHFITDCNDASMKCLEKSAAVERSRRRRRTISSSDDNEECCCSSSYSNDKLIPNSITVEDDNNQQPLLLFEGEKIETKRNGVLPANLHKIEFIDDQTTDDDTRLSYSDINGSSLQIGDFSMGLPQFKGKSEDQQEDR
uniref:Uncharacterized protein n=1 Tax=Romanomermis culicivorax TaxID=13658 RepID=A0A915JRL3_ROMCU